MPVVALANMLLGPADVARRMGLSIKTLRHYEKRGLLKPRRTAKGWRVYDREHLERLDRIQAFKAMGFGLAQIAGLLDATPEALAAALTGQELHLEGEARRIAEALDAVRAKRGRPETRAAA